MHPQRDLGLLTVSTERALTDQQPDDNALFKLAERSVHRSSFTGTSVSPSRKT
jgi:hypothetical protein